ncbi:ABC transporter permease [Blautia liquoris]|uniref:ABC transporter permease n=1 Tax=Blautia liquoris TaxID=2779518 RepID=A0A7M2RIY1_9FIRM|nr:ABC transporter permease [Blautia liquoris]QOV20286.1 ABC transporter permease [Blautia liquoris]
MTRGFYFKLAAQNIRKNGKIYVPYLLMSTFITAMFYILRSLTLSKSLQKMEGGTYLGEMLGFGSVIVGFFALIFLFYINSFIMKRRKKEFGLYSILGMEKRHIGKIVFWENFTIGGISIIGGVLSGILLNKLVFLFLANMLHGDILLGFEIPAGAIQSTILFFIVIQVLIFFNAFRQVFTANPIELLRGGNVGEREPNTKVLMTVVGFACLAGGYYLAVSTKDPLAAFFILMIAIILVMTGTYLTFTSGSIAFLKRLKKNKKFYYQTKHFVPVSGMIFRMKQNAIGLANIAILSTGVLLMVSTTVSLYADMSNIIDNRYPRDYTVFSVYKSGENDTEQMLQVFGTAAKKSGVETSDLFYYHYLPMNGALEGDKLDTRLTRTGEDERYVGIVTLEDYNRINKSNKTLEDGQILLYADGKSYDEDMLILLGKPFNIKEHIKSFVEHGDQISDEIGNTFVIIVKDTSVMRQLTDLREKELEDSSVNDLEAMKAFYGINVKGTKSQKTAFQKQVQEGLTESGQRMEDRESGRNNIIGMYSGLYFIGIFLSLLFLVAMVLIIYYKQISEGYDDRARFEIMQKVGMDEREIKHSINSQVLMVFFLPLITAGVHTVFAFPLMRRLLLVLGLNNPILYMTVTGLCYIIFAVFYAVVYKLTAKAYYRIVTA